MKFLSRPLAITDIETTGLDALLHEIVELAVLIVDQKTLNITDKYQIKVKPINIQNANRQALKVCGYTAREWRSAVSLEVAMQVYAEKTKDAIVVAHNVFFEWSFLAEAFKRTGVEDHTDYHRADIFSIAWARAKRLPGVDEFTLEAIARSLGIPRESRPHRAMNGALLKLAVLKGLLKK